MPDGIYVIIPVVPSEHELRNSKPTNKQEKEFACVAFGRTSHNHFPFYGNGGWFRPRVLAEMILGVLREFCNVLVVKLD